MRERNAELRQVLRRDAARGRGNADDALLPQSGKDIGGWGQPGNQNGAERLRDLAVAIQTVQRVYRVIDGEVGGGVEDAIAAADHGLTGAVGIPGEGETRPHVVLIRGQRRLAKVDLVAKPEIEREPAGDAPGIRHIEAKVRIDRFHYAGALPDNKRLRQSQVECLKRRNGEIRRQAGVYHRARQLAEREPSGEEDIAVRQRAANPGLASELEDVASQCHVDVVFDFETAFDVTAGEKRSAGRPVRNASCWGVGPKIELSVKIDTTLDSRRTSPSQEANKNVWFRRSGMPSVAPNCCRLEGGLMRTSLLP